MKNAINYLEQAQGDIEDAIDNLNNALNESETLKEQYGVDIECHIKKLKFVLNNPSNEPTTLASISGIIENYEE